MAPAHFQCRHLLWRLSGHYKLQPIAYLTLDIDTARKDPSTARMAVTLRLLGHYKLQPIAYLMLDNDTARKVTHSESSGSARSPNMLEFVWSQLQSCVNVAIAVFHQSIPIVNPEVRFERIPGEQEVYHGGFSVAIKCYLIGQGPKPEVVVVKCPKYIYDEPEIIKVRKMFERESRTWRGLNHRNILPLIGLTYQFGPIPCLITPWMDEGALTDFIHRNHGQLTMERRLIILHEVASGLRYLHHSGVIHGDLTGSNILVDQYGRICISDFGLSFMFLDVNYSIPSNICAHRWAATELFVHPDLEDSRPVPTTSCDIYSFGCVVWQVLSGRIPFSHIIKPTHVIILKYEGKDPLDERPSNLPISYWEFLQSTWSKQPESRPSSDQILAFVEEELERYRRQV